MTTYDPASGLDIPVAELRREIAKLRRQLADIVSAANRVELKFGRLDDGTPKDWQEWMDLRAAIEAAGKEVK